VTGGAASIFGVVTEFTSAFGGTFIDPFKAYKETRKNGGSVSAGSGAAAQGAAMNVGGMAGAVTKGALVSTPLALAEGLRQIPRLYGEEVRDHGKVTDWRSGGVVAAKVSCRPRLSIYFFGFKIANRRRTLAMAFTMGLLASSHSLIKGPRKEERSGFSKERARARLGL
jgi:hypothetical protein